MSSAAPSGTIADYLADLDRRLCVPGRYRRRVLEEVADHLTAAAEMTESRGLSHTAAESEAVARFGPAGPLAAEVDAGWATARIRRAPAVAFLAGVAVMVAAGVAIPNPGPGTRPGTTLVGPAGSFAFLAFQLALVAGGVALLRALARRSAPTMAAGDRLLVWRAARLCVGALGVSAVGLAVAAEQAHRAGSSFRATVAGVVLMAAVIGLAAWTLRRRLPDADVVPVTAGVRAPVGGGRNRLWAVDPASPSASARVDRVAQLAGIGETIVSYAREAPGAASALVALLAAWGAFAHAETGRTGSIVAAVVEAAAVVIFARVFGPTLELRSRKIRGQRASTVGR